MFFTLLLARFFFSTQGCFSSHGFCYSQGIIFFSRINFLLKGLFFFLKVFSKIFSNWFFTRSLFSQGVFSQGVFFPRVFLTKGLPSLSYQWVAFPFCYGVVSSFSHGVVSSFMPRGCVFFDGVMSFVSIFEKG